MQSRTLFCSFSRHGQCVCKACFVQLGDLRRLRQYSKFVDIGNISCIPNKLQITTENEHSWDMVIKALHSCTVEINKLKEENSQLKNKVSTAIGRTVRLEHDLQKANDELVELEWREMRQNLVFYNIEEKQNENISELIPPIQLIDPWNHEPGVRFYLI